MSSFIANKDSLSLVTLEILPSIIYLSILHKTTLANLI